MAGVAGNGYWSAMCSGLAFFDAVAGIHVFCTFAMTGLIWFVQVVHYPLLSRYPEAGFSELEKEHCDRTGFVVAPLMLGEIFTAGWLLLAGLRGPWFVGSLVLLGIIWLSTALLQVPLHRTLLKGKNDGAARRLVLTNWIRTVCWTGRAVCLGVVFFWKP